MQPVERVAEVYSVSDVSLVACRKGVGGGAFPSKASTIMATGTPVLVSYDDDSDLVDLVRASECGLCVEPDKLTFSTLPETDDPALLRTFTTLCAMMNKQALTQQRVQAKEASADNEKYAMRVWLLRLGMNGPEYKEERSVLMRNLSGHSAFRTDADRERWQKKQNEKRDALRAAKQAEANVEVTTDEVSE